MTRAQEITTMLILMLPALICKMRDDDTARGKEQQTANVSLRLIFHCCADVAACQRR